MVDELTKNLLVCFQQLKGRAGYWLQLKVHVLRLPLCFASALCRAKGVS